MSDLIRTRNTRTGDGRKIDEWSLKLPAGGSAKFDVILTYTDGEGIFSVQSDHPNFKKCRLRHPDLNVLREELSAHAADVIRREISADWEPALIIELTHEAKPWRTDHLHFKLEVSLEEVEWMPRERVGNRGETVVRNDYRQDVIVQRAHEDDFSDVRPKSGCLQDPETLAYLRSPLRNEANHKATRTVIPGRDAAPSLLIDALNRFSARLAERLAPASVSMHGLPEPSELVGLMSTAVEEEPRGWDASDGIKGL